MRLDSGRRFSLSGCMKISTLIASAALACLLACPAHAQIGRTKGPIDIAADRLEVVDAQKMAIWSGAVEARQDGNTLRADTMTVHFAGSGNSAASGAMGRNWGDIRQMVANGRVFFITPAEVARGNHAVYDMASDRITMTGDIVVTRGQNVLKGDTLFIDVKSGRSTLDSSTKGKSAPKRVRGVFYPDKKSEPAPAAQ